MEKKEISKECKKYGIEVDQYVIAKDYEGLEDYLAKLKIISESHNSPEYAPIFYYLGTGKGELSDYYQKNRETLTNNKSVELRKESLFYMRKAIELLKECYANETYLLLAYTNYANELDSCGRVIEALGIYRKAINLNPRFGMALGNYGRALKYYATIANDIGHSNELHYYAYQAMKSAIEIRDPNMHDEALRFFQSEIYEYEKQCDKRILQEQIVHDEYNIGESDEYMYRVWCLSNHLFLNPLNDLINLETAFAHDPLTIMHYTERNEKENHKKKNSGEPPKWFAMLNQLKEEYVYSRFLCYEGLEKRKNVHFADKEVKLSLSSFDYTNYSIRVEELKSAYKNVFSIFDQIAFFINDFWEIGIIERDASAAKVFNHSNFPKENIALQAIFWSYIEFKEKFGDAENPSEKKWKDLRNAFEHKFVKIHEYSYDEELTIKEDGFYHISENDLKRGIMRLLELGREWIIYLVYAIEIEERKLKKDDNVIQLSLQDFDDEWKL